MTERTPQKRIVSKGRYVVVMGKKVSLYSYGSLVRTLGILGILWMVLFIFMFECGKWDEGPAPSITEALITLLIAGLISLVLLWHSKSVFVKAKAIERVTPLTDQNAHLLPLQDTLVRSSDLPPTIHQADLLRAVQTGQKTPAEELLRATNGEE